MTRSPYRRIGSRKPSAECRRSDRSGSGVASGASRIWLRFASTGASRPSISRSGEVPLLLGLPVEGLDLLLRQPDQRIAALQGMVEECEGVVLRQRGQPERELGQVDRHRVLVHAVEAALGDDAAGVEDLVLVGRDVFGTALWACQALTSSSARKRQAATRNAPEPMAGSQTLRSRICSGVGFGPRRSRIGRKVVSTIGSVRRPRRVVRA